MKKFLVMAVFGLAGLAAFAGTCVITHITLISTDGTHKTFAGQLDNTSGANILQHNFIIAFLDSSNHVVETKTVSGCLRSVQNGSTDFFSATSNASSSSISTGLARIAFDGTFKVGTTSSENVSISNITANRTTTTTPATLTVGAKVTNNAGTTLVSPNACIVVRDSSGNVVITLTVSMSDLAASVNSTFSGSITVPNDSTASTVDIYVDGLDSSSNPTTPQSQTGTAITTGSNKLKWTTQPENRSGGIVFVTQPAIELDNSAGAKLTTATDSVTLSITSGPVGGALTCTTNPLAAVAGLASFGGCSLNVAGTYVLHAAASGYTSADSPSIAITIGAAHHVGFTTQPPASVPSMAPFGATVAVQDAGGNTVSVADSVTLSISAPLGAFLCTTNPVTATAGVATFTGCTFNTAGTYTLRARDNSSAINDGISTAFSVTVGPATQIGFRTPPAGAAHGSNLSLQPVVAVLDAGGNVVTTDNATTVTLSYSGPGAFTCTTNPVTVVAGVATFSGCKVDTAGTGKVSAVSVPVYTPPTPATITIT